MKIFVKCCKTFDNTTKMSYLCNNEIETDELSWDHGMPARRRRAVHSYIVRALFTENY